MRACCLAVTRCAAPDRRSCPRPARPRRCGIGARAYREGGAYRLMEHNVCVHKGCLRLCLLFEVEGAPLDVINRLAQQQ